MVTWASVHTRVAAPPVVPHPFGLFSVVPPISPAESGWLSGTAWESWACIDPNVTTDTCVDGGDAPDPKTFDGCRTSETFKAFTAYVGVQRSGGAIGVATEMATNALNMAEEFAVERELWAAMLTAAGALPAATDPVVALGQVEKGLAVGYRGTGIIHMDRVTATLLSDNLVQRGSQLITTLGTPVVVGAGYDTGDDEPGAIIGTGNIAVRRSVVSIHQAWNMAINDDLAVAERTFVVGWDCFIIGRAATIPGGE